MPTIFQKSVTLALIFCGVLACVRHLRLTTFATDTAALNRQADEVNNKKAISDVYVINRVDEKAIEASILAIESLFKASTNIIHNTIRSTSIENGLSQSAAATSAPTTTSSIELTHAESSDTSKSVTSNANNNTERSSTSSESMTNVTLPKSESGLDTTYSSTNTHTTNDTDSDEWNLTSTESMTNATLSNLELDNATLPDDFPIGNFT
jgi:hypothetical protein